MTTTDIAVVHARPIHTPKVSHAMTSSRLLLGLTMLLVTGVGGCGEARVESRVKGLVTGDGEPLASAIVVFQSLDPVAPGDRTFRVTTGADGRYELGGVRPGSYEVIVVPGGVRDSQSEQVVAADPLGSPDGGPVRVNVGPEPVDFDIGLVRRR